MTSDEEDLIRRFQRREAGSFDALYRDYGTPVYRFCLRLTVNAPDAEDLAQEVFVAAFQNAEGFEGRSSILTWLYRIAIFQWNTMRRRRKIDIVEYDESATDVSLQSDHAARSSIRMGLAAALESIPDAQRQAFVLVRGEGLRCREAAETLGIAEGTLKYRVHQAAVALQRALLPATQPTTTSKGARGGA